MKKVYRYNLLSWKLKFNVTDITEITNRFTWD